MIQTWYQRFDFTAIMLLSWLYRRTRCDRRHRLYNLKRRESPPRKAECQTRRMIFFVNRHRISSLFCSVLFEPSDFRWSMISDLINTSSDRNCRKEVVNFQCKSDDRRTALKRKTQPRKKRISKLKFETPRPNGLPFMATKKFVEFVPSSVMLTSRSSTISIEPVTEPGPTEGK